jgi:hypothetical protein|tara:strand:- start:324 stop:974 length:651 start_codon:yes stop_codon:yes gene_type:complete
MDEIKHKILFGFPVLVYNVNKKSYDKKSIISTIEKNFNEAKVRNKWDKTSVLHHSYDDLSNPKFSNVNFSSLIPIYEKILSSMINSMGISTHYKFKFAIVNYTCLGKAQFMNAHVHEESDFSAIHYIQFDEKNHTPTHFENTLPHTDFIKTLRPNLLQILSNKHLTNSWAFKNWSLDIKENDFCFFPAYLKHKIDPQTSKKKNRITVVLNITLEPK